MAIYHFLNSDFIKLMCSSLWNVTQVLRYAIGRNHKERINIDTVILYCYNLYHEKKLILKMYVLCYIRYIQMNWHSHVGKMIELKLSQNIFGMVSTWKKNKRKSSKFEDAGSKTGIWEKVIINAEWINTEELKKENKTLVIER